MKRFLLIINTLLLFLLSLPGARAQSNQTVTNGGATTAVNFTGAGCVYNWVNDTPGIGLPASGTGNIASFTTVNNGTSKVTATITATPVAAGAYAYITNRSSNTVSVISAVTNTVIKTVPVGSGPTGVTISPDGSSAFIANFNSGTVSVINTVTNTVTSTLIAGATPAGLAITPDGKLLYVGDDGASKISVVNISTNSIIATIPVSGPYGMAMNANGSLLYVVGYGESSIAVISTATNTVTATIPVGPIPIDDVISPDGTKIYVVNAGSNNISVIDPVTNTVKTVIRTGRGPDGIAISPDGNQLYVANEFDNNVSIIDVSTGLTISTVPVGTTPYGTSISADGNRLYVENAGDGTVSVIDIPDNAVIATVPVGQNQNSFGNFVTAGSVCSSSPVTFSITINPTAATPPSITATTATGSISACVGTASANPNIQQFTTSGAALTGNITATAPAGFELSLAAGSGYNGSVVLNQTAGTVSSTTIYVRSAASAGAGKISGNVVLSSSGATSQTVPVTGTVDALPTINPVGNQTALNGTSTAAINFTGTGNIFSWTNDTPGIGLAASGTGSIPSFIATNAGSSPATATITVTPSIAALAYIANQVGNSISVINTVTSAVSSVINVGRAPSGVSVSPDRSLVYVTDQSDNNVSVISTSTNTVLSTIPVGNSPYGIAVSPDGSRVYVVNINSNSLSVVNTITNTVVATVTVGTRPIAVAVSPDGSTVYVTNPGDGTVSVINAAINVVTATVAVGTNPYGVTVSPDGKLLYVTTTGSNTLTIVNTHTNTITATVGIGAQAVGVITNPDGTKVYVANSQDGTVSVINTATNTVTATITVGSYPGSLSMNNDGSLLYVVNAYSNNISVINTATNQVVATIPVGFLPDSFGNFIDGGDGCTGPPVTFTITINPTAAALPTINLTPATGSISACAGTASASPNIQQFTVSGSNLTSNITATAPADFEVSLSATSGFGNSVALVPTTGSLNNAVVYVRSAASAAAGSISGNVVLTATGIAEADIIVLGTINAVAMANAVNNQTVLNGTSTTAVTFSGTGSTFNWTNDTPGIGLAASGSGNIGQFTAVNTGTSPVTATITVTPVQPGFAYIANASSNSISVINTAGNTLQTTITAGKYPYGVAKSPDGSKVYVTNEGSASISVIATATNAITSTINLGNIHPTTLAVSPDGASIYVLSTPSNLVTVINSATGAIVTTFAAGVNPVGIAISPDGNTLYLTNSGNGTVSVVNTATYTITNTITVGSSPYGIAVSPDGSRIFVANGATNDVSVIDEAADAVITQIPVGGDPNCLAVSPDGSRVYVTNYDGNDNTVSVINTIANTVIATIPVGVNPEGISISPDGSQVFVTNTNSASVSIINTNTNVVAATVAVGLLPISSGNFVTGGTGCSASTTFTITVNPTPAILPGINASVATGNISACAGTASVNPNLQQFTISGTGLTGSIDLSAPNNFEISLNPDNGFSNSLALAPTGSTVGNTLIYVRSAANATAGNISGNVSVSSQGIQSIKVPVTGVVNALPVLTAVSNQIVKDGGATETVSFMNAGNNVTVNWVNDTPGIGLPAGGTGDIGSFIAINPGGAEITATITAVAVANNGNSTVCNSTPVIFTITVTPGTSPPVITTTGTLTGLNTIYGTPSSSESFTVSGDALQGGVSVTPPTGFELSTDNTTFSGTATTAVPGTVYIRLAAITPVGSYTGNIALSATGAAIVTLPMPASTVTAVPLTITADNKTKTFGTDNPVLTASYTGFVNNDGPGQLSTLPVITTTALTNSPPGHYPIVASGAASPNYSFTYVDGILTINAVTPVPTIPNTFTPNGDGINDTWDIKNLNAYLNCTVQIFNRYGQNVYASTGYGTPWDGTYKGGQLPSGTYYYIIDLKNGNKVLSGWIAIVK